MPAYFLERNGPASAFDGPGNTLGQQQPPRDDVAVPGIDNHFHILIEQIALDHFDFEWRAVGTFKAVNRVIVGIEPWGSTHGATTSRLDQTGAVPRPVMEAALKADVSKGPTVVGLALPDGYAVIRVLKSTPKVPDTNDALQAKNVFTNAFEESEAEAVYDSLKSR